MPGFGFFSMLSALAVGLYAIWTDAFRTKWELYWARLDAWESERRVEGQTFALHSRAFAVDGLEVTITWRTSFLQWKSPIGGQHRLHLLKWFGVPPDLLRLGDMSQLHAAIRSIIERAYGSYEEWEAAYERDVPAGRRAGLRREDVYATEMGYLVGLDGVMDSLLEALKNHRQRRAAVWIIVGSAFIAMLIAVVNDLSELVV